MFETGRIANAEIHFRNGRDERACLPERSLPPPCREPQSSGQSSENGPGAVVAAVVSTAGLSTDPWHKGLYNCHASTLLCSLLHLTEMKAVNRKYDVSDPQRTGTAVTLDLLFGRKS